MNRNFCSKCLTSPSCLTSFLPLSPSGHLKNDALLSPFSLSPPFSLPPPHSQFHLSLLPPFPFSLPLPLSPLFPFSSPLSPLLKKHASQKPLARRDKREFQTCFFLLAGCREARAAWYLTRFTLNAILDRDDNTTQHEAELTWEGPKEGHCAGRARIAGAESSDSARWRASPPNSLQRGQAGCDGLAS